MSSYKVKKHIYRDKHNALCSALCVVYNGQLVKPKVVKRVWAYRVWADKRARYSIGDAVISINNTYYRMSERVAKPLVLADGEELQDAEFHVRESFIVDEQHPIK